MVARHWITLIFVICLLAVFPIGADAEKVRTVVPRATLNYLSVPVAEVKGYFRDEGLENEMIVIPCYSISVLVLQKSLD